ncbi:hypothetical protein FG05_35153 [Fusarium graminearum]|nr:hypothetical protein FG05_35153 [Fusarium graminearum]
MHPSTRNRSKKKRKTCNEGKSSKGNAEWDREPGAWDGPTLDGSSVTDADNSGPRESEQVRDDDNHYHSATKLSRNTSPVTPVTTTTVLGLHDHAHEMVCEEGKASMLH